MLIGGVEMPKRGKIRGNMKSGNTLSVIIPAYNESKIIIKITLMLLFTFILFSTLLLYIGYNSLFLVVSIVLFILSLLMLLLREK